MVLVEIGYGVVPEHPGKGYATETAGALVSYAFGSGRVRVVRAHTRPEPNDRKPPYFDFGFSPANFQFGCVSGASGVVSKPARMNSMGMAL